MTPTTINLPFSPKDVRSGKFNKPPGDWMYERVDEDNGDIYWAIHRGDNYDFIANVYSSEKDAKLIASAPTLTEETALLKERVRVLEGALRGLVDPCVTNDGLIKPVAPTFVALRRARSALHTTPEGE